MNKKTSSAELASKAAATLRDPSASRMQKALAGSVMSQASSTKQTGKKMEVIASTVLRSSKYNEQTKAYAGSLVSQSSKER